MARMKRTEVLDLLKEYMVKWPHSESLCVLNKNQYRGSGWYWLPLEEGVKLVTLGALEEPISSCDWVSHTQGAPSAHESVRKTEQPAWDGEGLPPVGEVVEVVIVLEGDEAYEATIIGYSFDETQAAVEYIADRALEFVDVESLRPIRNDEEEAVREMVDVCMTSERKGWVDVCRSLYRAGYRKTEGV